MPPIKRVDRNQPEIVQALRQAGAVVLFLHERPGNLDILVAFRHTLTICEIKDGSKPASARRLTEAEQETIRLLASVGVTAHVITDRESALRAVGAIL